jgi:hypothetical protein
LTDTDPEEDVEFLDLCETIQNHYLDIEVTANEIARGTGHKPSEVLRAMLFLQKEGEIGIEVVDEDAG